jgi:molybdopterin converting factor small subunit
MVRSTIRVNYYAQLREALRTACEDVAVDLPARERDLLESLAALHPKQRDLFLASRIALDDGYIGAQLVPEGTAGVDIISPISGG